MTELKWQDQLIKYITQATNARIAKLVTNNNESDKPAKITVAVKYKIIVDVLQEVSLVSTLPDSLWSHEDKTIDLLRVYNPDTISWEHIDFLLMGLLSGIFGLYQDSDINKLSNYIFNTYRTAEYPSVPEPYSGSRYVLFSNGIFDAKQRKMLDIKRNIIKSSPSERLAPIDVILPQDFTLEVNEDTLPLPYIGFTDKHKHYFDLDLDAENPEYAGSEEGGKWTPEDWLVKTANGRTDQADYIMQLLGVMLVPHHSFNAFIEINGLSSGGKTTLINFVSDIYGNNKGVMLGYTLDDLNDTFPFRGNIDGQSAFVHITETNGAGLKQSGIALINSFANQEMQMKQMGASSITLTPPPLLVMEGKGWVLFDSTKTGIARRLLPIDITKSETAKYRNLRYGKQVFKRKRVLAYMAKRAMLAYADLTKGDDNFMFNIDDVETLPPFAQRWHIEAVNAGDDLMKRFTERMSRVLTDGKISSDLLYDLYEQSVHFDNPEEKYMRSRRTFKEAVQIFLRDEFELTPIEDMMKVEDEKRLGIDFNELDSIMQRPDSLLNYERNSVYAKFLRWDWFDIKRKVKV